MEDVSRYVKAYRDLRDRKGTIDAAYKQKVAPITEMMDKIENHLLRLANEQGVNSFSTAHGTTYKNKVTYCKVGDWEAFQDGLIERMTAAIFARPQPEEEDLPSIVKHALKHCDAWDYLTRAANKTVITELADAGEVVPGIELTSEIKMGFRAPTKTRS